jgi:hypothetical protein
MVTPGRAARDEPHDTLVIGRTHSAVDRYAVIVSLWPLALSDAARPVFSTDFM